jgi:YidC/Oxa1 family membrane protein insertase
VSELLQFLASLMVTLIGIFHKVTHTYWIDIILLTFLVRLILSPVNRKQTKTMKVMSDIQPEMKKLQEAYKDNPQEQQKQLMELYKKHNVNPFMGCLPMLIQMPILISLFYVLRFARYYKLLPGFEHADMFGAKLTIMVYESAPYPNIQALPGMLDLNSIFHVPFFLDKFIYLPAIPLFVLYIVTTILQMKQMQASNPSSQSSQTNFMMPLFLWFGLIFPVGLLLYFTLSNIFQMQQYYSIKKADGKGAVVSTEVVSAEVPAEEVPPPPKKRKKKRRR